MEGNISAPVRNPYLLIFPDDRADIFATSMSIPYCTYLSLNFSSVAMISFYILSESFFLKRKGESGARVVPITEKKYGFAVCS